MDPAWAMNMAMSPLVGCCHPNVDHHATTTQIIPSEWVVEVHPHRCISNRNYLGSVAMSLFIF
jgi:hypothetical protein